MTEYEAKSPEELRCEDYGVRAPPPPPPTPPPPPSVGSNGPPAPAPAQRTGAMPPPAQRVVTAAVVHRERRGSNVSIPEGPETDGIEVLEVRVEGGGGAAEGQQAGDRNQLEDGRILVSAMDEFALPTYNSVSGGAPMVTCRVCLGWTIHSPIKKANL